MCTAATYQTKDFYFGRTLDYEFSYGDEIVLMPRKFPISFRYMGKRETHYAILGIAHVAGGYPLYYDAINEKGVGMAGLNFVGNAVYQEVEEGRENVAQYEFLPWILSQCDSVQAVRSLLSKMNLVGTPFSEQLPSAQLHWLIADANEAVTVECTADGLHIYDNPAGVLTNNPPFPQQMFLLNQYMGLSPFHRVNRKIPSRVSLRLRRTAVAWARSGFRAICPLLPVLQRWHLQSCMQFQAIAKRKASASSSIFLAAWISREAAAKSQRENTRSRSIQAAAMQQKASIITLPTITIRSPR